MYRRGSRSGKRWPAVAIIPSAALLALVATGCSSSPAAPSSSGSGPAASSDTGMDALIAAAKKEGSLTLYTVTSQSAAEAQDEAFSKKYGVTVNLLRLAGSALEQRFSSEEAAGGTSADVIVDSTPAFMKDQLTQQHLTPVEQAGLPGYPWTFPDAAQNPGIGPSVVVQPSCIVYNTDLVKGSDVPTTWTDLLNPKWKGMVAVTDPSVSLAEPAAWLGINQALGTDFVKQLGAIDPKIYQSGTAAAAAVGAGEQAFAAKVAVANAQSIVASGAPVKTLVPAQTSGISLYLGLPAKAAHPNAAKLFATYVMSEEGAKVLADAADSVSPYDLGGLGSGYSKADFQGAAAALNEIKADLGAS